MEKNGEYDDHTFEFMNTYTFFVWTSSTQLPNFPSGSDMLTFTMR